MPSYPSNTNRYPGTGNAYPVSPKAYPGAGAASYPNGATPPTILGPLAWWFRADLGITIGTGVSAWADQSGNNISLAQGTGAAQPLFVASAINGRPAVRGDGADDNLFAAWARVAPGTQPFYIRAVVKQIASSTKQWLSDYTVNGFLIAQTAGTQVGAYNSAATNNAAFGIGTYARVESQFGNSTADYTKAGAGAPATGTNSGNNAGGGTLRLFNRGDNNASTFANVEIAEAFCFLGTPTVPQRAALDAYCTGLYGAGLV